MNKKYYHIIIVLLVVLNVFSWRIWWERPHKFIHDRKEQFEDRKKGPTGFLAKKLGFDETQQKKGEVLFKSYSEEAKKLNNDIAFARRELATFMVQNDEEKADSVLEKMTNYKMDLEKLTFSHFKSIRDICNKNQTLAFDSMMFKMMSRFDGIPGKRKMPPPPNTH